MLGNSGGIGGKRTILGVSVTLEEHEIHTRASTEELVQWGFSGVPMIISDDHPGLRAAAAAIVPASLWVRCQVNQKTKLFQLLLEIASGQKVHGILNPSKT